MVLTASHQHSAVNYFQKQYLSYVPAAPSKVVTPKSFVFENVETSDLPGLLPTPREGDLTAKTMDMLSDPPAKETRLTQFKASGSPEEHYVRWSDLATDLSATQEKIREELEEVQSGALKDLILSNSILAQSVLI